MNEEYLIYLNQIVATENNNKYTITDYISQGGNGFVFLCSDVKGNEFVLKLLHTLNTTKIENFKKEITLQQELNHKYIVKCVDSGEQRFGAQKKPRPFYIMKKYDSTLEDLLNANMITPLSAYKYSVQLCEAIKKMHKHKPVIIHRDLKPENILYDKKKDCILVCDFGLAHIESNNKTINNGFVGNMDYHAPEQKMRDKTEVGTYTDIYSIGLIINALFTKEIAQGEDYKRIWQVTPYFSFVDEIVERMIKHDINKRESDISSIILDLERHDMEYKVEESFFRNMYKSKGRSNKNYSYRKSSKRIYRK